MCTPIGDTPMAEMISICLDDRSHFRRSPRGRTIIFVVQLVSNQEGEKSTMKTQAPTKKGVERSIGGKLRSTYVGIRTHWHSMGRLILGEEGTGARGGLPISKMAGGAGGGGFSFGGHHITRIRQNRWLVKILATLVETDRQRVRRTTDRPSHTYATCNIHSFFHGLPIIMYASPAKSLPQHSAPSMKDRRSLRNPVECFSFVRPSRSRSRGMATHKNNTTKSEILNACRCCPYDTRPNTIQRRDTQSSAPRR
jgi:hypothetical protein